MRETDDVEEREILRNLNVLSKMYSYPSNVIESVFNNNIHQRGEINYNRNDDYILIRREHT